MAHQEDNHVCIAMEKVRYIDKNIFILENIQLLFILEISCLEFTTGICIMCHLVLLLPNCGCG